MNPPSSKIARVNQTGDMITNRVMAAGPNRREYASQYEYFQARLAYYRRERLDNANKVNALLRDMKRTNNSNLIAHLSGLVAARKDFARKLSIAVADAEVMLEYSRGYYNGN